MKIQNINFKEGSIIERIAKKYLLEHKDKDTITLELKNELGIEEKKARKLMLDYIWSIKKKLRELNNNANVSEVEVQEIETTTTNEDKRCLTLDIKEKGQKLVLCIKTNKKFEDYVKSKKEKRTTQNLWGNLITHEFYHGNLIGRNEFDDINAPIILFNSINYGIFRLVGISEGIEVEISNLVTPQKLTELLEKLSSDFIGFYKKEILKEKTAISLIIEEGVNNENQ